MHHNMLQHHQDYHQMLDHNKCNKWHHLHKIIDQVLLQEIDHHNRFQDLDQVINLDLQDRHIAIIHHRTSTDHHLRIDLQVHGKEVPVMIDHARAQIMPILKWVKDKDQDTMKKTGSNNNMVMLNKDNLIQLNDHISHAHDCLGWITNQQWIFCIAALA